MGLAALAGLAALVGGVAPTVSRAADAGAGLHETAPPARDVDRLGNPLPVRVFTDKEGRICRIYERRVMIDGGPATAFATVCRDANGRWVLSR